VIEILTETDVSVINSRLSSRQMTYKSTLSFKLTNTSLDVFAYFSGFQLQTQMHNCYFWFFYTLNWANGVKLIWRNLEVELKQRPNGAKIQLRYRIFYKVNASFHL